MFAPPLPTLGRIYDLGTAIGEIVRDRSDGERVAVIASGGLSHRLPWPKWFDALSDDDRFLVDAWLNGRDAWSAVRGAAAGDHQRRRRADQPCL